MFTEMMLSFYTNDPILIQAAYGPFYVILGVLLLFSVSIIVFNGVAGTANTRVSLLIEVIAILFYLSLAYYLAIIVKTTTVNIWMSEFLYFALLGVLSVIYLKRGKWMNKVI